MVYTRLDTAATRSIDIYYSPGFMPGFASG